VDDYAFAAVAITAEEQQVHVGFKICDAVTFACNHFLATVELQGMENE